MKLVTFLVTDEEADAIWNETTESNTSTWVTVDDDNGNNIVEVEVVLDSIKSM